jgi:hypothetical protein
MPWTLADDENPLDVVIVTDEPSFPGRQLWCRAIAVLWTTDDKGRPDAKILAAPVGRIEWQDVNEVPEHLKLEIEHFFDSYKRLESGTRTEVATWDNREAADREIEKSLHRWSQQRPQNGPSRMLDPPRGPGRPRLGRHAEEVTPAIEGLGREPSPSCQPPSK